MQLGQGISSCVDEGCAANFAFSQAAKHSSLLVRLSRQRCSFAFQNFIYLLYASHFKKRTSYLQHCIHEGNFLLGKCYPGVILPRVLIRSRGMLTPHIHPQWASSPHLGQSPPTKGHARGRGRLTAGEKKDNKASSPKKQLLQVRERGSCCSYQHRGRTLGSARRASCAGRAAQEECS